MNTLPIQVVHSGVTITYNERENKWEFTLRGRDRSYASLTDAKEFVDKPAPKTAKPFEKIPVWVVSYGDTPVRGEVTSVAERNYRRELTVWVKVGGDRRKMETAFRVFPSTLSNDELAAAIIEKREAAKRLHEECEKLRQRLTPLDIPEE